ncbi:MAG: hypothetical protein MI923_00255, partial [Phycisphaerales bacterium]|nr:hypothetical protein [Phycisphaerales bacterium]
IGTAIETGLYRRVSNIQTRLILKKHFRLSTAYTAPVSQKSWVQNLFKPEYFFQTLHSLLLHFKYMKFYILILENLFFITIDLYDIDRNWRCRSWKETCSLGTLI